jgi:hypothetical protein
MRRSADLMPIRMAALPEKDAAEAHAEMRIAKVWGLIVGPALVGHTRPLRIHRQTLVLGCWTTEVISNLRLSAEATWPQVQSRIARLLGIQLRALEIVPCDPPLPTIVRTPVADPLRAVLTALQKQHWTKRQK